MATFHAAIVHPDQTVTYCGEVGQEHVDEVRAVAALDDVPRFVKEHPRQLGAFFVLRPDDEGGDLDWYVPTDVAPYTVRAPDADAAGAVASLTATTAAGPAYIDGVERLGKQVIGGAMDHPESGPRFTWHVTVSPQGYFTSMASYLIAAGFEPQVLYDPKSDRLGQFGPLNLSARALQNDGARRTNREGKVNIQVEVVAMPSPPWTDGFDPAAKPNFRKLLAAGRAHGIPDVWPAGPPVSSPSQAMPRTRSIWQSKAGHYGHCHVPNNCVTADTPVLCADLTWRPAGDLLPGDELIAFHEDAPDQQGRRFVRAVVEANELRRDALYRVNTPAGQVRCNAEHPWLVRSKRGKGQEWGRWAWVETRDLSAGDEVMHVLDPWETERTWEAGWLAGMYDGEGSLCVNQRGVFLSCAQRVSDTADRMLMEVKSRVPAYSLIRSHIGPAHTDMVQATIQKRADAMRMLGIVRPPRLLAKADAVWEGGSLGKTGQRVAIDSIEPCGTGVIAALTTSSRTYIAGGFAMHNTHWDPGGIDISKVPGKIVTPKPTPAPAPKPAVKYEPFPGAAWFSMGRTSPIVTAMHDRLVAVGCGKYKSSANKNVIGSGDKASYEAWQEKCGFPGDWPPGKTTWDKLKVPNV